MNVLLEYLLTTVLISNDVMGKAVINIPVGRMLYRHKGLQGG